jgi:sugar-specific transcriptional regulator TrmB
MEILEQLGLTKTETKIYLALLEQGSSLAGAISRKSGIHRRSVYDAIERLIEKGLVSYIVTNNRKYFEAVNPRRLLQLVHEKEDSVNDILPQLELKYNLAKEKQETLFYKGKQGLKTIFEDQLNSKEILIFGASKNASEILKYYFPHYNKRRVKKTIKTKIIFTEKQNIKIPLSEIKYLPKEYTSPTAINIYEDKVAIILWAENPFAIVIKNKEISESYKKYFQLLWNISKK